MKFYHSPNSAASQKVRIVLEAKLLRFDSVVVDITEGEQFSEEYKAINPAAVVPYLVDNAHIFTESSLIIEYLEDAFPDPSLMPEDGRDRFQVRQILRLCDLLHQACGDLSYAVLGNPLLALKGESEVMRLIEQMPSEQNRCHRRSVIFNGIESTEFKDAVRQHRETFAEMNSRLENQVWLVGGGVSLADLTLAIYVSRVEHLGLEAEIRTHNELAGWYKRMKELPCYEQTFNESTQFVQQVMMQSGASLFCDGLSL